MYHLVYALLYLISLLPLRVLFLLSDFAYLVLYYIIRYRRDVVMKNLTIAFPNKSDKEKERIAKQFYRNFTDNFIESIKLISASEDFINRHFVADYSLFHKVYEEGRKCQVHLAHNFNWEFANLAVAANIPQKLLTVYMPIKDAAFDRVFLKLRSKTGAALLPATDMRNAILPWRNQLYALALVADQSPAVPQNAFWLNFFGRPTPFLKAPDGGARIGDLAVIFVHFTKSKRGYYVAHFTMGEEHPARLQKGELTVKYVRYLEQVIANDPAMWLWSHRRWKWEWKQEYGPIIG